MSMIDPDLDVDQYHNPHDSGREWRLRRSFLETHRDKLSVDRLLCMASVFINVECYGNTYPDQVMIELAELRAHLPPETASSSASYKAKNQVKFVKSSDSTGSSRSDPHTSMFDSPPITVQTTQKVKKKSPSMTFVKASQEFHSMDVTQPSTSLHSPTDTSQYQSAGNTKGLGFRESLQQFKAMSQQQQMNADDNKFAMLADTLQKLGNKGNNAVEKLQMAISKSKMVANPIMESEIFSKSFTCTLQIDFVTVAVGKASTKKEAKLNAFTKAIQVLQKPYLRINLDNPEDRLLESSDKSFNSHHESDAYQSTESNSCQSTMFDTEHPKPNPQPTSSRKRPAPPTDPRLFQFLIKEPQNIPVTMNSMSILNNSAAFNKAPLSVEYLDEVGGIRCVVYIGECFVADVTGPTKVDAKTLAGDAGLEYLRTICWTIQTKKHEDTDEDGISRDGLLGKIQSDIQQNKISDSNIGNKLLKKMGWVSGGLGKEGNEGIVDPIMAGDVINREGLGLRAEQGISKGFLPKIKQMVSDYTRSDNQKDLVFSPFFSKEERALIHKEAQKLGLKTHSHGTGEERYLVLSRKRTTGQLFSHVMSSGGETDKYLLIPPSKDSD